jgi:hypothetical protein
MYAGNIQCLHPSFDEAGLDIDCLVIEDSDDNIIPSQMLDPDFESDVYNHMRDPDINFPCKENEE